MVMPWMLHVHVIGVGLLMIGFMWRLLYSWHGREIPYRWLRRGLPDVVDTLVLFSGISMAVAWSIAPWQQSWFAWKLLCVVFYIVAGLISFSSRFSLMIRRIAGVWAVLMLVCIVVLVMTR